MSDFIPGLTSPFYQSQWVWLTLMILLLGVAYLLHRLKIKNLMAENKILHEKISSMMAPPAANAMNCHDFAYLFAHDLKAPLRGINQLATWILEDSRGGLSPESHEHLELILDQVEKTYTLVESILKFSHTGKVEEIEEMIDLNRLVADLIKTLNLFTQIEIIVENELPVMMISPLSIERVFQNLIGNAINYLDHEAGIIRIGCSQKPEYWQFHVADNGPGIPEGQREKIFQLFHRVSNDPRVQNAGVGLAVAKKIVELQGGIIWVESKVGAGSSFFFTLPKKNKRSYSG